MIFRDLPIKPEEIVCLLSTNVEETAKKYGKVDDYMPWTKAVFQTLKTLVEKHGGRAVFTEVAETITTEFMLDFVWWGRDENAVERVIMGAECEWASACNAHDCLEAIANDFKKLLCFKAPLKLFIFDCPLKSRDDVQKTLRNCLKNYGQHVKDECYVFVEFWRHLQSNNHRYKCEGQICSIDRDGPISDIKFLPLP